MRIIFPGSVVIVGGDAAGRLGIEGLLSSLRADFCVFASLGAPADFWRLPPDALWQLDELLIHADSLKGGAVAGHLLVHQARMLLPDLNVRVLSSRPHACPLRAVAEVLDYRGALPALSRALGVGRACPLPAAARRGNPACRAGRSALTRGEWNALAGAMAGLTAAQQARAQCRSVKTIYAHRYTGLRKLGLTQIYQVLIHGYGPSPDTENFDAGSGSAGSRAGASLTLLTDEYALREASAMRAGA